jgi:hypothetical protein
VDIYFEVGPVVLAFWLSVEGLPFLNIQFSESFDINSRGNLYSAFAIGDVQVLLVDYPLPKLSLVVSILVFLLVYGDSPRNPLRLFA